ncbi:GyrI-like domain-containing protein [Candidatus Binatia bacterium]|jgi:effector-binding domain-containing protein|nr:GyrI-like domain-containing protein [Candidatus Binatia bacterium]
MIEEPQIVELPEQGAAVIHLTVPTTEIRQVMGPGLNEVLAAVAAQGHEQTGAWFTHHLHRPTDVFDFEVGVPIAGTITATGRVRPGRLPAARVARAVHVGPYDDLASAWGELEAWLAAHGHTPASEMWEHYAVGPESGLPSTQWRTPLVWPLVR